MFIALMDIAGCLFIAGLLAVMILLSTTEGLS